MYSIAQLIEKKVIVAEDQDDDYQYYVFNAELDYEVQHNGADVIDGSITVVKGTDDVMFGTPCGMEHMNELDCKLNDEVFDVVSTTKVEL